MENTSTTELKKLARSILKHEHVVGKSTVKGSALPRVCEKLGRTLGQSAGLQGFRSLLERSLALSNEEFPGLEALQIKADGSLDGLAELKTKLNPQVETKAEIILLAQLLGLLVTFFGPELTLRLLLETWPATKAGFCVENQWLLSESFWRENHTVAEVVSRPPAFSTKSLAWTAVRTSRTADT